MHRIRYLGDAVLRQNDDCRTRALGSGDQLTANRVHRGDVAADARVVGTEALEVVIQMRQIHERQGRAVTLEDVQRAPSDPAR